MPIDLSTLGRPIAALDVGGKPLYFYFITDEDLRNIKGLPSGAAAKQRLVTLISGIASRELFDHKSNPSPARLPATEIEAWSEEVLISIATLMLSAERYYAFWQTKPDVEKDAADKAEMPGIEHVNKLIDHAIKCADERQERLMNLGKGSWSNLHSWAQDAQRKEFERSAAQMAQQMHFHNRLANDRAQELEDAHTTAENSIEIAAALQRTSNSFLEFVEQFSAALASQNRSQRFGLIVALVTFGITLLVAIAATIFAAMSYYQDKENNASNDAWQSRIEVLLIQQNKSRAEIGALTVEISQLREQIAKQEDERIGKRIPKRVSAEVPRVKP